MDLDEIDRRLKDGELLYCPECDLYHEESGICDIICCENPFIGYSKLSLEAHQNRLVKCYINHETSLEVYQNRLLKSYINHQSELARNIRRGRLQ